MKKKYAVIFDMDGVVVDNYHYHHEAWKTFCARHHLDFDKGFRSKVFGGNNRDHLETFFERNLTAGEIASFEEEKEKIYRDLYRGHIKPVNGLIPFLQTLKKEGIPVALATSSPPVNVQFVLSVTGTFPYFKTILDATHASHGKPDPEIYLKTAEALGLPPGRCIVFEDSVNGIRAAQRAGMKVIAMTTTHRAEELPEVDQVIPDFEGISLSGLEILV